MAKKTATDLKLDIDGVSMTEVRDPYAQLVKEHKALVGSVMMLWVVLIVCFAISSYILAGYGR